MKEIMLYIYLLSAILVLDFGDYKTEGKNKQYTATHQINKIHADPGGTN
ncbi:MULTISPECIES: hypothetical protein [Bacillus]|nr:hypothetical protein [Bacillus thuringiensis]